MHARPRNRADCLTILVLSWPWRRVAQTPLCLLSLIRRMFGAATRRGHVLGVIRTKFCRPMFAKGLMNNFIRTDVFFIDCGCIPRHVLCTRTTQGSPAQPPVAILNFFQKQQRGSTTHKGRGRKHHHRKGREWDDSPLTKKGRRQHHPERRGWKEAAPNNGRVERSNEPPLDSRR